MLNFSANLGMLWPELSLPDRIAAAAGAGFRAVELHFPYDHAPATIASVCDRSGVRLLGINTAIETGEDGHLGLAAVPDREADFAALADQALDWASAAGGTSVHVMAGRVPPALRDRGRATLIANLAAIAPAAAERGLTLLLEPLSPAARPGYFYSRVREAVDVIEAVGAPNLKLMFDVFHVASAEGGVLTRLRDHFAHVGHVQIAAVPSRAEPDEGEIAYRAVFDELERLGYGGWIGAEYQPRAGTDEGLVWTDRLGVRL